MDRRTRLQLSDLAARIMVESGMGWLDARTKAAKQLGIQPGAARQVEEEEITAALRVHQHLFVPEQAADLRHLREAALQAMRLLQDFEPHLKGSVAEGTATPHSPIELVLQADSEKDVEHLLLKAGVGYEVVSRPGAHAVQYRCDEAEPVVLLTVNIRRTSSGTKHGRSTSSLLNMRELETLLAQDAD